MKDVKEALSWLFEAFKLWLQCALRPIVTLNTLLPETTGENELSKAAQIWTSSLIISLTLSFPMLNLFGIQWNNVGFHLSNWTTTILMLVAYSLIFHRVLVVFKLKSEFVRTMVIYTTLVTVYSPVLNLMQLPATFQMLSALSAVKEQKLPIYDAGVMLAHNLSDGSVVSPGNLFLQSMQIFVQIFSFGCLVAFTEGVAQWYGNDRLKTYSAVAAALSLCTLIVVGIGTPLQLLVYYSFMQLL